MTIKMFWHGGNNGAVNFGDTISPLIVERMSGRKVVYSDPSDCDLVAIGSVLDKVVRKRYKRLLKLRMSRINVWGSGSFGPETVRKHMLLNIHAVRGPLTRDAMGLDKNLRLGDPGILVDRFDIKTDKNYRWGIIPHVIDRSLPVIQDMNQSTPHSCLIDLGDPDVIGVARKIASCEFILSSSLHGLITADAFGIPHIWTRVSGNIVGGDWKFDDYFSSVGRKVEGPTQVAGDLRRFETLAQCADKQAMEARKQDIAAAFADINL